MPKAKTPQEVGPQATPKLRTVEEVREQEFVRKGQSYTDWARRHKVSRHLLAQILKGGRPCRRGQSHKIAVLLGIKHGEIAQ